MKKRFIITLSVLALAVVCGAASAAALAVEPEKQPPAPPTAEELASEGYILTEVEGGVGVYHGGELILTAEVDTAGLRAGDRELLRRGIEAASYEDVLGLIEDFIS